MELRFYSILYLSGDVTELEAVKALCRADTLLSMKHGLGRLDNVWGWGGGIRKYLVKRIELLPVVMCRT